MTVELGKHQLLAISKLKNGSILTGGVGTGKSRTAIAYYYLNVCRGGISVNGKGEPSKMIKPLDLYIITTAKKRNSYDWQNEAHDFKLSKERTDNIHGTTLTVDSWNNIGKYNNVKGAFFIFDEQRLVGSGAWVKAFRYIARNNQWILLSATPGDTWMDYVPVFIANGFYRNRTEFTQRHVVYARFSKYPKVQRYLEEGVLQGHRDAISVDMPYTRHTRRHDRFVGVSFDAATYDRVVKARWHVYEERPTRDIAELISVARRVVNSDPSRCAALGGVLQDPVGPERLIVFYNFNYELYALREECARLEVEYAEWNGHKHEEVPSGDRWVYLVQYTAGSEAWNCILTNKILFYSLNYSYRVTEQCKGRIERLNTPFSDLYYFTYNASSSVEAAIRKALREKRNFNERDFS